ncbi:hypothetical protein QUF88_11020 [Bacillus sp. DX1.1]|uniref:hypothetical protein n=1 Tax=Bacillus sp. DX3.1 TaxID=3052091 RepID=UPI00256FAD36|nr:hypothetical protein [Bacillus sp. DX3.1]MDM5154351.1 hypothetical protein [Bacillus sp. DX1.1]WJE83261.1 hypothetical protein QRE67_08525 [Bacillus sp. DX3.1]
MEYQQEKHLMYGIHRVGYYINETFFIKVSPFGKTAYVSSGLLFYVYLDISAGIDSVLNLVDLKGTPNSGSYKFGGKKMW